LIPTKAGEILAQSLSQLERDIHPVVIISAYNKALKEALEIIKRISIPIDTSNDEEMLALIKTSIGTKFVMRWSDLMCKLALQAVRVVAQDEDGMKTVDIKRYARVEKVPGGEIEQSRVLNGVMLNKDITHPNMRRRIMKPRIILLDCPLEYKKGESQTNMEFSKEGDWARAQDIEEEQVKAIVNKILEFKPDLVITEKGISGALLLPFLHLILHADAFPRYCTACIRETQCVCYSESAQIGQQSYRARCRRHDCQSGRRPPGSRRRHTMRTLQH
jgi:T-complex protein 1 subunit gamma